MHFFGNLKKLKKSKLRFDSFIGQIIGLYPKLLGLSVLNYIYIEGVEIFRLVFLKASSLLKYYTVNSINHIFSFLPVSCPLLVSLLYWENQS